MRNSHLGPNRLFDYYALLPVAAMSREYKVLCSLQAECGFGGSLLGSDAVICNDTHWRPGWIPILDADGDKIVLDLDPAPGGTVGQVFAWSNSGSWRQRLLAPSFGTWLEQLAEELVARRFSLDRHGGIWMRDSLEGLAVGSDQ